MNKAIESILRRIFTENLWFDDSKISENTHLVRDLGLCSLDFVELFMSLDEAFGIETDDVYHAQRLDELGCRFGDIATLIKEIRGKQPSPIKKMRMRPSAVKRLTPGYASLVPGGKTS